MAVKLHARGNFELFCSIFTKISPCGSPILPLDYCVILYDVFKAMCDVIKVYFSHLQLSGGIWHIHNTSCGLVGCNKAQERPFRDSHERYSEY